MTTGKSTSRPATAQTQQVQSLTVPARRRPTTVPCVEPLDRHADLSAAPMRAVLKANSLADPPQSIERQSARIKKLREQHLPGEQLHQRTAFPSTIAMRHEAACTLQSASQSLHVTGNAQAA